MLFKLIKKWFELFLEKRRLKKRGRYRPHSIDQMAQNAIESCYREDGWMVDVWDTRTMSPSSSKSDIYEYGNGVYIWQPSGGHQHQDYQGNP